MAALPFQPMQSRTVARPQHPKTIAWNPSARGVGRCIHLALIALMGLASLAHARIMPIRPIVLASGPNYSVVAAGTITTSGNTGTILGWNATLTVSNRITRYLPSNTSNMSYGPISCDGTNLRVATSPDGIQDGGMLYFRSSNPYQDFGVAVADFTGMNVNGGQAMYMAGAAFDFLPLNQPNHTSYIAATRSSGNVYSLVQLDFYSGVRVTGTITTDGTIGSLTPSNIVGWDIVVDQTTVDPFTQANSTLLASLVGLDPTGTALTVLNPDGYLTFSKGYIGGHPYALTLADFTAQAPQGGQAAYYHGSIEFYTVNLNAPPGAWLVTEVNTASVGEPVQVLSSLRVSPNPARGSTQVEYALTSADEVTLEVYDLLGREIRRLTDVPRSAGVHAVTVDVSDLTPGIYFCRLRVDGQSSTVKVLVRR